MQKKHNDTTTTIPVPKHKELKRGTLKSILLSAIEAGVPRTEFEV
jgi:predicted RNA binding protein YcfA (HicA-like mRNA interferase family)